MKAERCLHHLGDFNFLHLKIGICATWWSRFHSKLESKMMLHLHLEDFFVGPWSWYRRNAMLSLEDDRTWKSWSSCQQEYIPSFILRGDSSSYCLKLCEKSTAMGSYISQSLSSHLFLSLSSTQENLWSIKQKSIITCRRSCDSL